MTLIIEDGSDVANADSYVTTDELVQYCADFGYAAPPSDKQEPYLRRAAAQMQTMRWQGQQTNTDQSLVWPRQCIYIRSVYNPLPSDAIPLDIKRGQSQLALDLYEIDTNPIFDAGATGRVTSITKTVTGAVSISKSFDNTGRSSPPSPTEKSDAFFAPFLASGGALMFERA